MHLKLKACVAESIGTFAVVFAGTGAMVVNDTTGGMVTHAGIALTFGLVVLAMIYAVGDLSGAHFNPAVTSACWLAGRFPGPRVFPYILSQCAGAFAASITLHFLFPSAAVLGCTIPAGTASQSFILELILAFLLMFVIFNVSTGAKEQSINAGLAIGSVVGLEALFAGPISGASMNPARSLAPAIVSGHGEHLWIYLTAPFIGAWLAVLACRACQDSSCCPLLTNHRVDL